MLVVDKDCSDLRSINALAVTSATEKASQLYGLGGSYHLATLKSIFFAQSIHTSVHLLHRHDDPEDSRLLAFR